MTLDQVLNRLSKCELLQLKKCAEFGMMNELMDLLRAYGYGEDEAPATIGQ